MIELRRIDRDNVGDAIRMEVAEDQRDFVASNAKSLAQAYAFPEYRPLLIYADGQPVGFAMYAVEKGELWIFRCMIDRARQGRGLGRAGMEAVLRHLADTTGAREVFLSYVPANARAERLYLSLGFRPTGRVEDGEAVMVRPLRGGA